MRELHHYLSSLGYLPNAELAAATTGWEPLVDTSPANESVFDESTARAIRVMQRQGGIAETGVVDAATRELMAERTCGTPENGAGRHGQTPGEAHEKFLLNSAWTKTTLTWRFISQDPGLGATGSVCPTSLDASTAPRCTAWALKQINLAFQDWSNVSSIRFTQVSNSTAADISIYWTDIPYVGIWAQVAEFPKVNQPLNLQLDNLQPWTRDARLREIARHEIGHAIGLAHSSVPACTSNSGRCNGDPNVVAAMRQGCGPKVTQDDVIAVNALYPKWETIPGCARDIGAGKGHAWKIDCTTEGQGEFGIYHWNGNGWDKVPGGAHRIAVSPTDGSAWVVGLNNTIWHSSDPSSGPLTFSQFTNATARDIGVTSDGWPLIVTTDNRPFGGFIKAYACAVFTCDWYTLDNAEGTSVAGGRGLEVWITNNANQIWHRPPAGGSWSQTPGGAFDVGVNISGSPFVVGVNNNIYVYGEQIKIDAELTEANANYSLVSGRGGIHVAVDDTFLWVANNQETSRMKIVP